MILLIEDDVVSRHIITALLARLRFAHRLAASADEARAAAAEGPVDLVILDLAIPDAEAVALLAELRARPSVRAAAALLCTSFTDHEAVERVLATGTVQLVRKPIDVELLAAAVDRAMLDAPVK